MCASSTVYSGSMKTYSTIPIHSNTPGTCFKPTTTTQQHRNTKECFFFKPRDTNIQFRLLNSYLKAGQYSFGIKRTQLLYPQTNNIPHKLSLNYGHLLMMNESYEELEIFARQAPSLLSSERHSLQIGQALFTDNWKQAQSLYFDYIEQESDLHIYKPHYSQNPADSPQKNQVLLQFFQWRCRVWAECIPANGKMA